MKTQILRAHCGWSLIGVLWLVAQPARADEPVVTEAHHLMESLAAKGDLDRTTADALARLGRKLSKIDVQQMGSIADGHAQPSGPYDVWSEGEHPFMRWVTRSSGEVTLQHGFETHDSWGKKHAQAKVFNSTLFVKRDGVTVSVFHHPDSGTVTVKVNGQDKGVKNAVYKYRGPKGALKRQR
jgi:hypothetical protein